MERGKVLFKAPSKKLKFTFNFVYNVSYVDCKQLDIKILNYIRNKCKYITLALVVLVTSE
jgi:hypothetical protein